MEGLDLKQMSEMARLIAEEKGLPEETVLDVIQMAIAAAWRKENGEKDMNVRAVLNTKSGEAIAFIEREIVDDESEEPFSPVTQILLSVAKKAVEDGKMTLAPDSELEPGGVVEEKHEIKEFGRVAAMTAKQVVIQRLREAERDAVLAEFEDKVGEVVTGTVARVERNIVRIDVGRASGIMPRSEQIDGEFYTVGSRIKVLIKGVERDERGAQLIFSRGSADFIEYLFRQEVPELESGAVEIKAVAREAGKRTKIAVTSTVQGVDPVGTFVGGRGMRVQAVMNEIGDREKIDIVNWSDNPSEYIREALAPAEIVDVVIDGKKAKVMVNEDQQSIAIGRQGQNVRLASKLTDYEIDVEVIKKSGEKKKRKNVEDALLSAIEEDESVDPEDESQVEDGEDA